MANVRLKLRKNPIAGFDVTLYFDSVDRKFDIDGFLPDLPATLETAYQQWQTAYRQNEGVRSCIAPAPGLRLTPKSITHHSTIGVNVAVRNELKNWLNSGDDRWQPIRDTLIAIPNQHQQTDDKIRVILDAKDTPLRRLPWQEWNVFEEHYPHAEVALTFPRTPVSPKLNFPKSDKIRILVTVGRSDGINTNLDVEVIQKLKDFGAEVTALMQPSLQTLCDALWDEQGYHIFVFTGHSGSDETGQIGWIEVNETESLSIEQFKHAMRAAIDNGLQLAIFNSCDGLGLANELAQLHLPRCIVMREPVPDPVAVDFLKHFFADFVQNRTLFTCIHNARRRLEPHESRFPGATWLPTLCTRLELAPLTWNSLKQALTPTVQPPVRATTAPSLNRKWMIAGAIALISLTGLAIATRFIPQKSEPSIANSQCPNAQIPEGAVLRIRGSGSMVKITEKLKAQFQACFPQVKLDTLASDSAAGVRGLETGKADLAAISRTPSVQETNKGWQVAQIAVGVPIAIAVKKTNPFQGNLTQAQIEGIFRGKITEWADVGGPSAPLRFINPGPDSGTHQVMRELVLNRDSFGTTPNIVQLEDPYDLTQQIGKLGTTGITYISYTNIKDQATVRILTIDGKQPTDPDYPYRRPLNYLYKDTQNPAVKAFLDYATSPVGQKAIQDSL
jgi:ABC-type phosphate transport system substrate-binding protein